jgi:hypothetical protein
MKYNEPRFEEGYDSDGEIGPHSFVVEEEGEQDYEEEDLPSAPPVSVSVTVTVPEVPDVSTKKNEASGHQPIAEDELVKMKRSDLVEELKKRGQVVGGKNKEVLLDRLRLALKKKMPVGKKRVLHKKVENPKTDKKRDETAGFAPGSYWQPLVPSSIAAEPLNPSFTTTRAPTIPVGEADFVSVKHDFAEVFNRPIFSGTYERVVTHRNTRVRYDMNGNLRTECLPRDKGGPDPAFIKKHKLSIHSHPADYAEVFIPYTKNPYDGAFEHPSFQTWTKGSSSSRRSKLSCPTCN